MGAVGTGRLVRRKPALPVAAREPRSRIKEFPAIEGRTTVLDRRRIESACSAGCDSMGLTPAAINSTSGCRAKMSPASRSIVSGISMSFRPLTPAAIMRERDRAPTRLVAIRRNRSRILTGTLGAGTQAALTGQSAVGEDRAEQSRRVRDADRQSAGEQGAQP